MDTPVHICRSQVLGTETFILLPYALCTLYIFVMHNELSIVIYVSKHEDIANYALYILIPCVGKLWQGEILANGLIRTN